MFTSSDRAEARFVAKADGSDVVTIPPDCRTRFSDMSMGIVSRFLISGLQSFACYYSLDRTSRHHIRLVRRETGDATVRCTVAIEPHGSFFGLSIREHEIATDVSLGLSSTRIAKERSCSPRTVESHVANICAKFQVSSRLGIATLLAARSGWLLPLTTSDELSPFLDDIATFANSSPLRLDVRSRESRWQQANARTDEVLLGVLNPMGTERAYDNQAMLLGEELAIQEVNESRALFGGQKTLRAVRPSSGVDSPEDGLAELLSSGVDALIVGNQPVNVALDLLPRAAESGIPTLHSMVDPALSKFVEDRLQYNNIFQLCSDESVYLKAFKNFLLSPDAGDRSNLKTRRVAVIQRDSGVTSTSFEPVISEVQTNGWDVVTRIYYDEKTVSWAEVALELYQANVETVYLGVYLEEALHSFLQALSPLPFKPLVFCSWVPGIPGFIDRAGELAENLVWCTIVGNGNDYLGRDFDRRYMQRFRSSPGVGSAAIHYDMVRLLVAAWNGSGSPTDGEAVSNAISTMVFRGAAGPYCFDGGRRRALCFPFDTDDQTIGQVCTTYQIVDGNHRLVPYDKSLNVGSKVRQAVDTQ